MQTIKELARTIIVVMILVAGVSLVSAWTAPTQTPPGGNVAAPVNVGATTQFKSGAFGVGGLFEVGGLFRAYGNAVVDGSLGIGTVSPTQKLDVAGKIKAQSLQIAEGASAGKVLTSDANGNATWQDAPTGGASGSFNFALSVSPTSGSFTQGSSIIPTVTAFLNAGATQSVSFSNSGLPGGASGSFAPASCSPSCSTAFTISTLGSTLAGIYPITISATGGGVTKQTVYSASILPKAPSDLKNFPYPFKFTWQDNSTGETGFQIEMCQGVACANFGIVHTTAANVTSWADNTYRWIPPLCDKYYKYRVKAMSTAGSSNYSNISGNWAPECYIAI